MIQSDSSQSVKQFHVGTEVSEERGRGGRGGERKRGEESWRYKIFSTVSPGLGPYRQGLTAQFNSDWIPKVN